MKKIIKNNILGFVLGLLVAGTVGVFAYSYVADQISYTTDKNANVKNVQQAVDDLYEKYNTCDPSLIGRSWTYDYSGSADYYEAVCKGIYKLEVWGASGGYAYSTTYSGGLGGYASGYYFLDKNQKIFIYVGGAGKNGTAMNVDYTGGYNGGGTSYHWFNNNTYSASGGGATHIALTTGKLSNLGYTEAVTNRKLLIVAGGGGGAYYANSSENALGGHAGGLNGLAGGANTVSPQNGRNGKGGTQTAGGSSSGSGAIAGSGSFGQGGNSSSTSTAGGSGGGGGFYGGGGSSVAGAGGGSSYIDNLIRYVGNNPLTKAGNEQMPTHDGTGNMIGNNGNGYAKITLVSAN